MTPAPGQLWKYTKLGQEEIYEIERRVNSSDDKPGSGWKYVSKRGRFLWDKDERFSSRDNFIFIGWAPGKEPIPPDLCRLELICEEL